MKSFVTSWLLPKELLRIVVAIIVSDLYQTRWVVYYLNCEVAILSIIRKQLELKVAQILTLSMYIGDSGSITIEVTPIFDFP